MVLERVSNKQVLELGNMQELELVRSTLELELACSKRVLALVRSKMVLELGNKMVLERSMLVQERNNRSSPYGIRTSLLRW